jgi:hypothetical protein
MKALFSLDKIDLIRETIIVLFGLVARWYELRKLKKEKLND